MKDGVADMAFIRNKIRKISPFRIITFAFLLTILAGGLLLSLPAATVGDGRCVFLDALFTSGSAVCVTGLVVQNTATYWSVFGKTVILILIQIGGLGVVTVVIAVSLFTGKRIGLWQRNLMQNSVNAPQLGGIIRFTRFMLLFTVISEGIGMILLSFVFVGQYGLLNGIQKALFHSVSAFCNAGFDLLGDKVSFSSLTRYHGNILLNLVIMSLIIVGGLGFLTWEDLLQNRFRLKKCRMQTRIILITSLCLILFPALAFFFFEFEKWGIRDRILMSLFQSVTTRTAGFNTADFSDLSESGRLLTVILMLIGGSPGSTAGGLKTTTFAVVLLATISFIRQQKHVNAFGRRITTPVVREAFILILLYLLNLLAGTMIISRLERLPVLDCMFECASALGTVGLTTGITPSLGNVSKILLILFMYFGRVGGLTLAYSALAADKPEPGKLPVGQIMVG